MQERHGVRGGVHRGNVGKAVAVEVGDGNRRESRADREGRAEAAGSVAVEDNDGSCAKDEIELFVPIEIGDGDRGDDRSGSPDRGRCSHGEGSVAVAVQNGDLVDAGLCDGEIQLAVFVEIARGDRDCRDQRAEWNRCSESAVAVAGDYGDVTVKRCGGDVVFAILVEISDDNRRRSEREPGRMTCEIGTRTSDHLGYQNAS